MKKRLKFVPCVSDEADYEWSRVPLPGEIVELSDRHNFSRNAFYVPVAVCIETSVVEDSCCMTFLSDSCVKTRLFSPYEVFIHEEASS